MYSSRPDLKEEPLEDAQDSWFTDGSSFIRQGIRKAGYAVTTANEVIESQSLPAGTSAQKAEIITLTRALELAKGKKDKYMDRFKICLWSCPRSWSNLEGMRTINCTRETD